MYVRTYVHTYIHNTYMHTSRNIIYFKNVYSNVYIDVECYTLQACNLRYTDSDPIRIYSNHFSIWFYTVSTICRASAYGPMDLQIDPSWWIH